MGICHNNKRETLKTNSTVFLSPEGNRVAEVTSNKNQASLRYQDALFLCEYNERRLYATEANKNLWPFGGDGG